MGIYKRCMGFVGAIGLAAVLGGCATYDPDRRSDYYDDDGQAMRDLAWWTIERGRLNNEERMLRNWENRSMMDDMWYGLDRMRRNNADAFRSLGDAWRMQEERNRYTPPRNIPIPFGR